MLIPLRLRSPAFAMLVLATGCGDDAPTGAGGSGGSGGASASTSAGATTSTSSAQGSGGSGSGSSGSGGGDAGAGGADAGAGGDGGGGGAAAAPHPVEIALLASPADGDRSAVQVLVNDAAGALLERLHGDELPAVRDLADGWTVTLLGADAWSSSITSVRITPEVDRVEHYASLSGPPRTPCGFGAPMELTFEVPEVAGAAEIQILTSVAPDAIPVEPGTATVEVIACAEQESIDALVVARDADDRVIALELLSPLPYVPGGSASHVLTMPAPTRATIDVDLGDTTGAAYVRADVTWFVPVTWYFFHGLVIHEPHHFLDVTSPPSTVRYAPSVVAPGIGVHLVSAVVATTDADGWCGARRLEHGGRFGGPTSVPIGTLRRPVPIGDAAVSWVWDGGGTLGDVLTRSWKVPSSLEAYPGPTREIWWMLADDPRAPARSAALPELPEDLPPDFEQPTGAPVLHGITHGDDEATASYADRVRAVTWPHVRTWRSRTTQPCP